MNAAMTLGDKAIDTSRLSDRRILRFESINDCLDEANRLAPSYRPGACKGLGNWTLGADFRALGRLG